MDDEQLIFFLFW